MGFPSGSDGKDSACNAGDPNSIPGLGGSPVEGNGNPLQYSCLENSMDRGDWWAMVHGIAKSQTRLSDQHILYSRVWGKIPCHLLLLKMSCIGYSSLIALSGYDDEIW